MNTEDNARYYLKNRDRIRLATRHRRRTNVAATILVDAKRADTKRGRSNDLDLDFVKTTISYPCTYCGESKLRMTLDRIDNAVGHVRTNVVPACERCNYLRRDMPYAAWYLVAGTVRTAREQGLFGNWTGGIHRRFVLEPVPILPKHEYEDPPHGTIAKYQRCGPPSCAECRRAMRDWKRGRRSLGP